MPLITNIRVERFRSLRDASLVDLGAFSVLAGLNNAGKSNFLRALCCFFTNKTDESNIIDVKRDYYRPDLKLKRRKVIRVTVGFDLPVSFNFRHLLEPCEDLLGRKFSITKEWNTSSNIPDIYLNDQTSVIDRNDTWKIDSFLSLINFRYIPNRVIPTDLIKQEHESLRGVLLNLLARRGIVADEIFKGLSEVAEAAFSEVSEAVTKTSPGITKVKLATATSLADIALRFGYLLTEGDIETDQAEQGSGTQSLLMFKTLQLIDTDYRHKFGWKQATVWAVEEPESSLHTKLETEIAQFLAAMSGDVRSRLQSLCTTHSDIFIQYADKGYLVEKDFDRTSNKHLTSVTLLDNRSLLEESAKCGIVRWVNPILRYPGEPVVLVEGRTDKGFFTEALRILRIRPTFKLVTLADLTNLSDQGGVQAIKKFIKNYSAEIKLRSPDAPLILILDWDSASSAESIREVIDDDLRFRILVWNVLLSNPNLDESFRGLERFYSDRLIQIADVRSGSVVGTTGQGRKTVTPKNIAKLKKELGNLVEEGLRDDDIIFAESFIRDIIEVANR